MIEENENRVILLVFIVVILIAIRISINILFFNQISFSFFGSDIIFRQSALLYGSVFIIFNIITYLYGAKLATFLSIISSSSEILFAFLVYSANFVCIDESANQVGNQTRAIIELSEPLLKLTLSGALASLITYIAEIYIFSIILKVFDKNILLVSFFSIFITILTHDLIMFPIMISVHEGLWRILFTTVTINMTCVLLISFTMYLFKGGYDYFRSTKKNPIY